MRHASAVVRGLLPGVVALAASSLALAAGPVLVDGLAPDTAGRFDATRCRSCDVDRARSGLCQNECATCRDPRVKYHAGREGCAPYAFTKVLCASTWLLTADGVPVTCFPHDVSCLPCTGARQTTHECTSLCLPCRDTGRTRVPRGNPPDSCRVFDGDQRACEGAWQLAFTGVPIACFYTGGECHACGVAQQLAGLCTNTCLPCQDASRTRYADGPGDPCVALVGDRAACESSWYLDAGSLPTSCFYTAGTERNQGGFLFIQDGFDRIGALVTNGRKRAVCIGCNGTTAVDGFAYGFDESTLPALGWTRAIVTEPGAIDAFFAGTGTPSIADAGIVYMPSQQTGPQPDGIRRDQVAVANARAAELAAFVRNGGGLFAHNQAGLEGGFAWLGAVFPGVSARSAATCRNGAHFTSSGTAWFPDLTDANLQALDDQASSYFAGDAGAVEALAEDECRDVRCRNPSHPNLLGGPDDTLCGRLAGDAAACNAAWYVTGNGLAAVCSATAPDACIGCGPMQDGQYPCPNPCAACDDPARTRFMGDLFRVGCESLGHDQAACATAWMGARDGLNASCFVDARDGACRVCSTANEREGLCRNLCEPEAATRAVILGPRAPGPTFASIVSRLDQLIAILRDAPDTGRLEKRLVRAALRARAKTASAESRAGTKRRKTKSALHEASRRMARFNTSVRSRTGRRAIPEPTRTALRVLGEPLLEDLRALRSSL